MKCSNDDFARLFREIGPAALSRRLAIDLRAVYRRRSKLEKQTGEAIVAPDHATRGAREVPPVAEHPHRIQLEVKNGTVLVGSDAHIWPGPLSTGVRGFIRMCKELKPKAVVMNGDVMDFPQISRHPPIGWENMPTVVDEIEAAQDVLHQIELAAGRGADKVWTLGNHDARFETRLATVAPEYARINGVHLRDSFPQWQPSWSVWVNENTVIKHRFKGGIHAPHNNTMWAGKTMVTGHLHSAKVTPFTDYNGTRYGVDAGCLASPDHTAFIDYTEDAPKNWRSGFCVLTYVKGMLLPPELALVWDEKSIVFRGKIINV